MIAAAVVAAAGCGDDDSQPVFHPARPGGALITYTRSGGIAATTRHLVVQEDGSATVRVEGPGDIGAEFRLSDAELRQLRSAIDDATLEGDSAPTGCADCYSYEIAAGREHGVVRRDSDPARHAAPGLAARGIVERETPTGPARNGWDTAAPMASANPEITVEFIRERLAGSFPGDIGIEPIEISDEHTRGRLVVERRHLHPGGLVHGGVWVALADTVGAWQTFRHLLPGATSRRSR